MGPHQSNRRRFLLLRHGEVAYFTQDGRPVKAETVDLTEEGRRQAEAAHEALKSFHIDRAITSGLPRTVQTATIVTGDRLSNGLRLETVEELQEIRGGRIRDLPRDFLEKSFTGAFATGISRDSTFLGGESFGSLWDRVSIAWDKLLADPHVPVTLIVAHGAVNRVILSRSLKSGLDSFGSIEQDACCINVIDVDPGGRSIVRLLNFTPYNATKAGLTDTTMERLWKSWKRSPESRA